jgi:uncharacterized membrane protein YeaQ/YmgE (transglycosylase-associated protein family)
MGVLGWIVFGLVVGIVAKFLMPGRDPGGFVVTVLLGIVGALLDGYLGGRLLGWYREGDAASFRDGRSGRDHRAGRLPAAGPKGAALAQVRAPTPFEVRGPYNATRGAYGPRRGRTHPETGREVSDATA